MRELTWKTDEEARATRKARDSKSQRGQHLAWWEQIAGSEFVVDAGDFTPDQLSEITRRRLPRELQRRKGIAPAQQESRRSPMRDVERVWRQIAGQARKHAESLEELASSVNAPAEASDLHEAARALREHADHAEEQHAIWQEATR